jgi:predicted nucleic acid-binding protein
MEAQAVIFLIQKIIDGTYILCNSDIIEYEWSQMPMMEKKFLVKKIIALAKENITLNEEVTELANGFENSSMKAYDALHLASSILGRCDCFISTDDKLVKKAKKNTEKIKVFNPLEFYIYEVLN